MKRYYTSIAILGVISLFALFLNFALGHTGAAPASSPASTGTRIANDVPAACDYRNSDVGCGLNSFNVTSPVGGQQFCTGSTVNVEWTAPADMDVVSISVRASDLGKSYGVGDFPAAQKHALWHVTNIPVGATYKLWINSHYKGQSVNNHSIGLFAVKDCALPSVSPIPTSSTPKP